MRGAAQAKAALIYTKRKLAALFDWFWKGFPNDLRSGIVGAIVASLISFAIAYSGTAQLEISVFTNDHGISRPFTVLMGELQREYSESGKIFNVRFDPPNLEKTDVCEYAQINGSNTKLIFLEYLSKYSACFVVSMISEDTIVIRPNRRSGIIYESNGSWQCKCATQ